MCYHRSHGSWLIGLYQRAIFSRWHQSTMFHRKNCWTDDSPKNRKGLPCEAVGRLIDRISSETAPIGTKQKMMKLSCVTSRERERGNMSDTPLSRRNFRNVNLPLADVIRPFGDDLIVGDSLLNYGCYVMWSSPPGGTCDATEVAADDRI